jgi:hypothetical protein
VRDKTHSQPVGSSVHTLLITGVLVALCLASAFAVRPAAYLDSGKGEVEQPSIRATSAASRAHALKNSTSGRTENSSQKQSRFNPLAHQASLPAEVFSLSNTSLRRLSDDSQRALSSSSLFFSRPRGRAPPLLT